MKLMSYLSSYLITTCLLTRMVVWELISSGHLVSTICTNKGELHPWSTWPTFHRGVTNTLHNINYINQDLSEINSIYPPIWLLLNRKVLALVFWFSPKLPSNNNKLSLLFA